MESERESVDFEGEEKKKIKIVCSKQVYFQNLFVAAWKFQK